jgi:hypothetical protein
MSETEVRAWLRKIIEVVRTGTELTDTAIDDNVCEMVLKAIDSDLMWSWLWTLIGRWLVDENAPILVSAEGSPMVEAINPLTVIAVIQALIALWKTVRPN